ncbi:MAG: DMT family transporter [SAR324 cluster bacterium]|nr:DMT family transporter [SAR324 cluster bacterium]
MPHPKKILGLSCAIGVIVIWSGFIVFSRAGMNTRLTAYDITALRFLVAGSVVLPFLKSWWPKHLPLHAALIMSVCGPGAIYSVLMYLGVANASAAYAGVFANGSLPVFTMLIVYLVVRESPGRGQLFAVGIIAVGGILVGWPGMAAGGINLLSGIMFLFSASAVLSVYFFGIRFWRLEPRQALVLVNVPNLLVFLPLWYFFLPSGMHEVETFTIVFQALFQGLGPGFLAVILFSIAATILGPTKMAGFSAAVPASAALMAIPVLNEFPSPVEWTGIAVLTLGLGILIAVRS